MIDTRCEITDQYGKRCNSTLTVKFADLWICNYHYEERRRGVIARLKSNPPTPEIAP